MLKGSAYFFNQQEAFLSSILLGEALICLQGAQKFWQVVAAFNRRPGLFLKDAPCHWEINYSDPVSKQLVP